MYDLAMVAEPIDCDESLLSIDGFAAAWAAYEQLGARLARAVGWLDAADEYRFDGSVTMTAWLRHHCRMADAKPARWYAAVGSSTVMTGSPPLRLLPTVGRSGRRHPSQCHYGHRTDLCRTRRVPGRHRRRARCARHPDCVSGVA